MIKIEVLAPAVCCFDRVDKQGYMEIAEGTTVREVIKIIKLPLLWRVVSFVTVNNDRVDMNYILKDKDVLSVFMPVAGG